MSDTAKKLSFVAFIVAYVVGMFVYPDVLLPVMIIGGFGIGVWTIYMLLFWESR